MIIGIDCFKLVKGSGKSIGIYNYAKNLVNVMSDINKNHELYVFGNKLNLNDFSKKHINFVEIPLNPQNKLNFLSWELFEVSRYIKKYNIDVMIFPRGFMPLKCSAKSIITVHDLIPFYYYNNYPGYFNKYEDFYIRNRLKSSINKADKIVTISEFSKNEIINLCGNVKNKISVIYNGYNIIDKNIKKEKVEEEYIFAITSELPHKNAIGILKSYEKYYMKSDDPLSLRIVGIKNIDKYNDVINQEVFEKIRFENYLSDDEFYSLFKNATIFIFLSVIEGFGFPPLESMNLGVPVICSNRASLPEVVGKAAILVNPDEYSSIAEKISFLQNNKDEALKLIKEGYENLKRFKWEDKIIEYMDVIEKLKHMK